MRIQDEGLDKFFLYCILFLFEVFFSPLALFNCNLVYRGRGAMLGSLKAAPALIFKSGGEQTTELMLGLTTARDRIVVRLTGGCGDMSATDAEGLYTLFTDAFGEDFGGVLLFGGTQMLRRDDFSKVVPGITEVPPLIRRRNPYAVVLGVIPRTDQLRLSPEIPGLVVSEEPEREFITIAHPDQDYVLVVQHSPDQTSLWDAEYLECLRMIELLRNSCQWNSLLIAFNGGGVTEREILAHAHRGYSVLLVADSGRVSERLAGDAEFRSRFPNVSVAEKSSTDLRAHLFRLGVLSS